MLNFLHQPGGLHMVLNGNAVTVAKSDKHYAEVVDAIKANADEADVLAILDREKVRMQEATEIVPGIELKGGQLYYENEPIAGVLGERMLSMLDEGFDLAPMAQFLKNLLDNPSRRVVEHLYEFLEVGKNPITEDGHFLAYKAVGPDFKDIHSGKFDNSVGAVLAMARHRVDENPQNTCSHGFHVCSFAYLPSFAHANGHVVVCKVNPADVVAIPADYNNTKMRTARYQVIAECMDYYGKNEDTLAQATVRTRDTQEPFVVETDYDGDGDFTEDSRHGSLLSAARRMQEFVASPEDSLHAVRVINSVTGTVLDEKEFDVDSDGRFDEDTTFSLRGVRSGMHTDIASGFESVSEAVVEALQNSEEFESIEVVDSDGTVVKTIT